MMRLNWHHVKNEDIVGGPITATIMATAAGPVLLEATAWECAVDVVAVGGGSVEIAAIGRGAMTMIDAVKTFTAGDV